MSVMLYPCILCVALLMDLFDSVPNVLGCDILLNVMEVFIYNI